MGDFCTVQLVVSTIESSRIGNLGKLCRLIRFFWYGCDDCIDNNGDVCGASRDASSIYTRTTPPPLGGSMGSNKMKYGFALGLIFGLLIVGSGYGQDMATFQHLRLKRHPTWNVRALTAKLASYFPGVGDSSEITLASCEADCCGDMCLRRLRFLWGCRLLRTLLL